MERPKAHHYVPVWHLTRFSADPKTVAVRERRVANYNKRSGRYERRRCGAVAKENDLYTTRGIDLAGVPPEYDAILAAVLDARNKDSWLESDKVEIEDRGRIAFDEIESWPAGRRQLTEEQRVNLLTYVGLLLAQHPTMMRARADLAKQRFWEAAEPVVGHPPRLEALVSELIRGSAVMGILADGFEIGLELNYLAWTVVRYQDTNSLVLGDTGVAAWYKDTLFGIGDPWTPDAMFIVPVSPSSVVILGGFDVGACEVEDRSGREFDAQIQALNAFAWGRARTDVFAASEEDLRRAAATLGPIDPNADHSRQLAVRGTGLPRYRFDEEGEFHVVEPPEVLAADTHPRLVARFAPGSGGEAPG